MLGQSRLALQQTELVGDKTLCAERMATSIVRVSEMYGEFDRGHSLLYRLAVYAREHCGKVPLVGDRGGVLHVRCCTFAQFFKLNCFVCFKHAYAGNVAHGLLALMRTMREKHTHLSQGEIFFLLDGTPKKVPLVARLRLELRLYCAFTQSVYCLAENLFKPTTDHIIPRYFTRHSARKVHRDNYHSQCDSGIGTTSSSCQRTRL